MTSESGADPTNSRASAIASVMRPRSVAIIGFSAKEGSAGQVMLELLHNNKFDGPIHFVGRSGGVVDGRPVLDDIQKLPEGIDLAVFTLPASGVPDAVQACVQRKVKAAVVFASGFAEVGLDGESQQERISQMAKAGGLRIVGPNCLGFSNFVDGFAVGFASAQPTPRLAPGTHGAVAIVAQSGGMGSHLQNAFAARNVPVSCWISTGNEVDLGLPDFLQYLLDDPVTGVITLYAEHIRHPKAFLQIAETARDRVKPIVMLHPGRSTKAQEAARSHTGALAGNYAIMRALVERSGVVLVDTMDELLDVSEILSRFPKRSPGQLGVMTFSGAFCGIAHDFCDAMGLSIPPLSSDTEAYLKPLLPAFIPPKNPLDLGTQPIWQPELVQTGAEALLRDPAIGALAISIPPGSPRHAALYVTGIINAIKTSSKPVALSLLGDGSPLPSDVLQMAKENKLVLSRSSDRVLRAMGKVLEYGNNQVGKSSIALPSTDLPSSKTVGSQPEWFGKKLLSAIGIGVPAGGLASTVEEAVSIARKIGYPVAMKAQAADLEHKTEAGAVALNIGSDTAVHEYWSSLRENVARAAPQVELDGILVERMSPKGLEIVLGAKRDPDWGPVLLVGLGGIFVEALNDVRLLPVDVTRDLVLTELSLLKTSKMLHGFRDIPPVDVDAIADAILALGTLMRLRPDITEIDVNPLMAHAIGNGATALDALIVTGSG